MIRVFLLALVALAALMMVADRLPYQPAAPAPVSEPAPDGAAGVPDAGPFARWGGVWEGTISTRRPGGTLVEAVRVRQERTIVSAFEQKVVATQRGSGGGATVSIGIQRVRDYGLESRLTDPNGIERVFAGGLQGDAIFWYRRDPVTRREESYREEILRTPEGDLYTIDGFRFDPVGETLVYEGRFRRVESLPR